IQKLNDPGALERIDKILELDQQRRRLLTESEAIQAHRNRLNKGVGRLRGDKKMDEDERARRAYYMATAISQGDFEQAEAILSGGAAVEALPVGVYANTALDQLTEALRGMGDQVNAFNNEIGLVESQLNEHMLWLPNMPHAS